MEIKPWADSLDLFQLFLTKEVIIYNNIDKITLIAPSIKDVLEKNDLSFILAFLKRPFSDIKTMVQLWNPQTHFDVFMTIINEAGKYAEFAEYQKMLLNGFKLLFKEEVQHAGSLIYIGDAVLTESLYDYIIFLVHKISGDKVEPPRIFKTEEERLYYQKLKENEDRIKKIRQNGSKNQDVNSMLKCFITIQYAFPQYSFDYLADQTIFQIT